MVATTVVAMGRNVAAGMAGSMMVTAGTPVAAGAIARGAAMIGGAAVTEVAAETGEGDVAGDKDKKAVGEAGGDPSRVTAGSRKRSHVF